MRKAWTYQETNKQKKLWQEILAYDIIGSLMQNQLKTCP